MHEEIFTAAAKTGDRLHYPEWRFYQWLASRVANGTDAVANILKRDRVAL
ncbi:hypothetical protein H6F74_16515 [Trichocoleus sp. FACHB-90]|nr:hypothetical protein [Trichocoleus sp. FACHB-90]MBD1927833.1 hypothetical protein [Trichocoleus sp. FACHB-90]